MAYQSKKHRKFLATSLTAAMVASAVAPTAGFAAETTKKEFSDVPANHWAKEAIDYLVGKGALEGRPDGKFDLNAEITRGEAAKILSITLGLKVDDNAKTNFADAANHWSSKYIAAIQDQKKDVIKGYEDGTFRPNAKITRQEMAKMIVTAYDLKLNEKAGVSFTDNTGWGAEFVNVLASLGVVEGVAAGKFAPNATVTRAQTPVFVHRAEVEEVRKEVPSKVVDTPNVVSVKEVHAREITVKFGKAVDQDSILDETSSLLAGKIELNGVDLVGELAYFADEDGKELTIILTNPLTKGTEYTATVDNVLMEDATKFPKFSTAFKADETVAPSVSSVTSVTKEEKTRTVTVNFSEPVSFNSIKVNGKFVTAVAADQSYTDSWTLTTPEDLNTGQTYEVEINGLKDSFGNTAENILKTTVAVTRDTVKPTFTVKAVGEKSFDIVFDKKMSAKAVAFDGIYVSKVNAAGNTESLPQAALATKTGDKTYRVTLANIPFDSNTQNDKEVSVTVKNLEDYLGNVVESKTEKVVLTRDTVKPTISSVRTVPGTQDQVEATFSESVKGIAVDAFSLTDANGNAVKTSSGATITVSTVGNVTTTDAYNKVKLQLSANLPASGSYKLVLKQGKLTDNSTAANANDAQVISFSFSKATGTVTQLTATITNDLDGVDAGTALTSSGATAARKVVVEFNTSDVLHGLSNSTGTYVDGAADHTVNYTLNGAALPAGSVVTFIDAADSNRDGKVDGNDTANFDRGFDSVVIDFSNVTEANLPTALKEGGVVAVSVANVKSAAGSTLAYTAKQVTVADTTAPKLSLAYLSGKKSDNSLKLQVHFTEDVVLPTTLTDANDDLVLVGQDANGNPATISLAAVGYVGTSKSVVEFNVTSADIDVTKGVKLHTAAAQLLSIKDAKNNTLGVVGAVDSITVTNYSVN